MSSDGKGDPWELLASSLGVDSTPASEAAPPAAAEQPAKGMEPELHPRRTAPPAKRPPKPGSWDDLASALGVEVPTVEPPPRPAREPERKVVYEEELSPPFEPLDTPDEILSEIQEERDAVETEEPRAEQPGSIDESEERRRRRRRRRGRGGRERREAEAPVESETAPTAEATQFALEPADEALEPDFVGAGESAHHSEAVEGDAAGGGKRRRRRRRGKGERHRESPRGDEPTAERTAPAASEEPADATVDDHDMADHDLADHDDDDPDDAAGDKSLHRAIPSWQEAIGMIIAVNMESRAKHPERDGSRGRGGRDRGGRDRGSRDRGRRDRGSRDSGRGGR